MSFSLFFFRLMIVMKDHHSQEIFTALSTFQSPFRNMTIPPAPVAVKAVPFLRPLDQGTHCLAEFLPVIGKGILDPWRDLGEGFPVDQVCPLQIFQHIGEGPGADAVKPLHDVIEADLLVVANDADDKDRPFFCNNIDDAFERAEAEMVTMRFHSHCILFTWHL